MASADFITGATVHQVLEQELTLLKNQISMAIEATGQRASGRTQASLDVQVTDMGGTLYGRNAFGTLETGRKGGRVPRNFAAIIRQWMKDKGIEPSEEKRAKRMAGAIAWSIHKNGTRLYRNGGRADVYSDKIPMAIERIQSRITAIFAASVSHIKLN